MEVRQEKIVTNSNQNNIAFLKCHRKIVLFYSDNTGHRSGVFLIENLEALSHADTVCIGLVAGSSMCLETCAVTRRKTAWSQPPRVSL